LQEAAEKEWHQFREERTAGIADINNLRQRVAEDEARRKTEKETENDEMEADRPPAPAETGDEENKDKDKPDAGTTEPTAPSAAADMEVDSGAQREENKEASEHERKEEPTPMQPDDEDAVEY